MKKSQSKSPEIRVRNLPYSVVYQLKLLAKKSSFHSFNAYMTDLLTRIVEQEGLTDFEMRIKKENQRLSMIIEKNTDAILDVIDYLDFD